MSDSDKRPITPEELLAGFRDQVEMDRIEQETAAMSHEELLADLRKDGIDPAAVLAKDRAMIERFEADRAEKPAPIKVRDIRTARRWPRWVPHTITAAGALAAAAALTLVLGRTGNLPTAFQPPQPTTTVTGALPPLSEADYDRFMAYSNCFREEYEGCLHYLDEAKKLDPEGDQLNDAAAARRMAELGLAKHRDH
jgi:hypothetical protein